MTRVGREARTAAGAVMSASWPASRRERGRPTVSDMQLTDEDIEEFVDLWKREYGETLSSHDARCRASLLIELFSIILPQPKGGAESKTVKHP